MSHIGLVIQKPGNIRVLEKALADYGHRCSGASSMAELGRLLGDVPKPDLALVDTGGFGRAVWSMCEELQHADVPFVVLSTRTELSVSSRTLRYGASGVIEKPVIKTALLQLIDDLAGSRPPETT